MPRLSPVPTEVAGISEKSVSLNGTWQYTARPQKEFWTTFDLDKINNRSPWKDFEVPGVIELQGLEVPLNDPGACYRTFSVPQEWQGMRVILRCDAVANGSTIYINTETVGRHASGFTTFEHDITDAVKFGSENAIAIALTERHLALSLANASYARHNMAGIPRKLYIYPVPNTNIASLHVETDLDENYTDATLRVITKLSQDAGNSPINGKLKFHLVGPDGTSVPLNDASKTVSLSEGEMQKQVYEFAVTKPLQWNTEDPNLYILKATLSLDGQPSVEYQRRFGFREFEIRGNEVFVNGNPIKLRGINRHEHNALTGRSVTPEQSYHDAKLFKSANINLVRTSHYPPAEEFIAACDELGLFVVEEGPFCMMNIGSLIEEADRTNTNLNLPDLEGFGVDVDLNQDYNGYYPEGEHAPVIYPILEMIERDRSSASIIMWSIANESKDAPYFEAASRRALREDPTRMTTFTWQNTYNPAYSVHELHYPHVSVFSKDAPNSPVPLFVGELRLSPGAYICSPQEVISDPSLNDYFGEVMIRAWEAIYANKGALGGAIWCGMDEQVHMPDGTYAGIAEWGIFDEWRRPKGEFWNVRNVYSPVKVNREKVKTKNGQIMIPLQNRFHFTNLDQTEMRWKTAKDSGTTTLSLAPGESGTLILEPKSLQASDTLDLEFFDRHGRPVIEESLALGEPKPIEPRFNPMSAENLKVVEQGGKIHVLFGESRWAVDQKTGRVSSFVDDVPMVVDGPHIWAVAAETNEQKRNRDKSRYSSEIRFEPLNGRFHNWACERVSVAEEDGVRITIEGSYDEAKGNFILIFDPEGSLTLEYAFSSKVTLPPRQIGAMFDLAPQYTTASWVRDSEWTTYPEYQIGRTTGTTNAFRDKDRWPDVDFWTEPTWPWALDETSRGTRDFRSTKRDILRASLDNGQHALVIHSDGSQAARTLVEGDVVTLAGIYYNQYVSNSVNLAPPLLIKKGDSFSDSITYKIELK